LLVEIRFHGRGGQGAVTAANLLADAAVREGKYAQAFPYFGAERRGAPVVAFARISDKPIETHARIENPDIVVVLDPKLFELVDVTQGLKECGSLVSNYPDGETLPVSGTFNRYCVDATKIALNLGLVVSGWPVVNTTMLGALAKATGVVSVDSIVEAIRSQFKGRLASLNVQAVLTAVRNTREC